MNFLPKQSQYPNKVYVGNETYAIVFVKNLDCFGDTDPASHVVRLKDGMSRRSLFITFVHEMLHVIEFEHSIPITHKMVYQLERGITELLFDNFLGGVVSNEDAELRTKPRRKPARNAPKRPRNSTRRNVRKTRR